MKIVMIAKIERSVSRDMVGTGKIIFFDSISAKYIPPNWIIEKVKIWIKNPNNISQRVS